MGRRWGPSSGALLFTETADQCRIGPIILVAQQFALAESFDLNGIDHADRMAQFVQIKSDGFAIRSSGFQAGMNRSGFLFVQPGPKFSKAFFAVSELAMA